MQCGQGSDPSSEKLFAAKKSYKICRGAGEKVSGNATCVLRFRSRKSAANGALVTRIRAHLSNSAIGDFFYSPQISEEVSKLVNSLETVAVSRNIEHEIYQNEIRYQGSANRDFTSRPAGFATLI